MTRLFNIFSNAAYLVAAAAVLPNAELCTALIALALGSGLYHAVKNKWTRNLDRLGMYLVFSALIIPSPWVWVLWFGLTALEAFDQFSRIDTNTFLGLSLVLVVVDRLAVGQYLVFLGVAILGFAYWLWHKDGGEWWSDLSRPYHALWHVLTAIGIVVLVQ